MKHDYERTTCACEECVQCCKTQPGSLAPGDLERIAKFLGRRVQDVLSKFWASPGALALNTQTGEAFRIGTITPRRVDGACIFLKDDRCSIHPVAPFGCSHFDVHMDPKEGRERGTWLARMQQSEAYQSLRRTLVQATSYHPRWL